MSERERESMNQRAIEGRERDRGGRVKKIRVKESLKTEGGDMEAGGSCFCQPLPFFQGLLKLVALKCQ